MGDRLRVGKPSWYVTSHLGQLSLAIPLWVGRGLSGNALVSINVVTLHRARLVSGWVTAYGWVNHLGM